MGKRSMQFPLGKAIKEEEYSDALKMEPNPTIYLGTFKKE